MDWHEMLRGLGLLSLGAVPETKDLKSEVWVKSHQSAPL